LYLCGVTMAFATEKRNVVVAVTGSIAAYKSAELVRLLISRGYAVRVVMTEAAQRFIGKATFEALTSDEVLTDLWDSASCIAHIELANWADCIVVAPASATTIARLAAGSAEEPLSATVLASKASLVIAPAMNVNMYENKQTQQNIEHLRDFGATFVGPDSGALACGILGKGRMAEPWEIFYAIRRALSPHDWDGQTILVTAGLTRDSMDVMHDLTQISSIKLGVEITREAYRRGAKVCLVHTGSRPKVPSEVNCVEASSSDDMRKAVLRVTQEEAPALAILASISNQFRSLNEVDFAAPVDLVSDLGKLRADGRLPLLMAFAASIGKPDILLEKARRLISSTSLDMLIAKFAEDAAGLENNELWLMDTAGREKQIATSFRSRVATQILDAAHHLI